MLLPYSVREAVIYAYTHSHISHFVSLLDTANTASRDLTEQNAMKLVTKIYLSTAISYKQGHRAYIVHPHKIYGLWLYYHILLMDRYGLTYHPKITRLICARFTIFQASHD